MSDQHALWPYPPDHPKSIRNREFWQKQAQLPPEASIIQGPSRSPHMPGGGWMGGPKGYPNNPTGGWTIFDQPSRAPGVLRDDGPRSNVPIIEEQWGNHQVPSIYETTPGFGPGRMAGEVWGSHPYPRRGGPQTLEINYRRDGIPPRFEDAIQTLPGRVTENTPQVPRGPKPQDMSWDEWYGKHGAKTLLGKFDPNTRFQDVVKPL